MRRSAVEAAVAADTTGPQQSCHVPPDLQGHRVSGAISLGIEW